MTLNARRGRGANGAVIGVVVSEARASGRGRRARRAEQRDHHDVQTETAA
jgi:hypothetical protein